MSRRYNRRRGKKPSKAKNLNALAYKLGLIEKGLQNHDSQVYASFNRGKARQKYKRKPLI